MKSLGSTIMGGPIVDLSEDVEYPKDMNFLAQLNCKELKPYDFKNLLPETGYIFNLNYKAPGTFKTICICNLSIQKSTYVLNTFFKCPNYRYYF
jgi:hypothetical protein